VIQTEETIFLFPRTSEWPILYVGAGNKVRTMHGAVDRRDELPSGDKSGLCPVVLWRASGRPDCVKKGIIVRDE